VERDRYEKKIDYDKILFPYEKYFKKFSSRRSILKTMFIRANPGCFDCLYKDIPRGWLITGGESKNYAKVW
jgi:hypothetical protein